MTASRSRRSNSSCQSLPWPQRRLEDARRAARSGSTSMQWTRCAPARCCARFRPMRPQPTMAMFKTLSSRSCPFLPGHAPILRQNAAQGVDIAAGELGDPLRQRLPGVPGRADELAGDPIARCGAEEDREARAGDERRRTELLLAREPSMKLGAYRLRSRGEHLIEHGGVEQAGGERVDVDP